MSELALQIIRENIEKHARGENATTLDLGNCGLTELPEEALECVWVKELILSSEWSEYSFRELRSQSKESQNKGKANKIATLPVTLSLLNALEKIVIAGLREEKWELSDLSPLSGLRSLRQLSCESTQVSDLSSLSGLTNLQLLDCESTQISDLLPLSGLVNLKILNCFSTYVSDLLPLSDLTSLQILYCSSTSVSNLLPLSGLINLQTLICHSTLLFDLSPLSSLVNLQYFSCAATKVSDLSPLSGLINLRILDCSSTNVSDLSPVLSLIERKIPVKLERTYGEKEIICVKKCPLTIPPIEVAQQGNSAILEYFRQKKETGEDILLEAKIILLGDGRSGKTSLANRLLGKPLPTEADRTQGVDIVIGEYEFPVANNRKFKLHIWDFAGQDKYKPLHQFFYTESSLYVMVAESGNARTDFDDWLQTAELFGEGSPLVVVLNEFRDGIGLGSFDREIWQKRFPNLLKDVFVVNLGTKRGFEELEHQIRLLAQSLPHTRYPFPKNWANIRRELEGRRNENFISFQEYRKICAKNNILEKESALILSSVLHKIGVCLHYQKSDLLKQLVILKNEWATDAVYKILEDSLVAEEKKGFFNRKDLERIWSDEEYCDMHPQLLELMQQFKMAYPLPGNHDFVTPPLLPPAPPSDWEWPETDALEIFIEYEFLPKALMTQFIVSRHPDIDKGKTLVWRNGVALRWPDALAEVIKTKSQGRDAFFIRSQGHDRKGLMTVILKTFRDLHGEYRGIKSDEKVPCPCVGCKSGKNKQHYFDFENLKNRLEKGRFVVECDKSLEELDLLKLLENHFVFEKIQAGKPLVFKRDVEQVLLQLEPTPLKIFISYSKHDLAYKDALLKHLSGLRREKIATWHDRDILAGEDWDKSIKTALMEADIVLYLVTANSLATDYIQQIELPLIAQRCEEEDCRLIPVIVDYCDWTDLDFAKYNALPEKGIPITDKKWTNENQAWLKVVEGVKAILQEMS